MNLTEREAHLIGGPLGGNSITRTGGRWPAYLDDTGHRLATTTGDREFARTRRGETGRRYYMFQRHGGKPVYVHLTEMAPSSGGDTDQQRPCPSGSGSAATATNSPPWETSHETPSPTAHGHVGRDPCNGTRPT